VSTPVGADGGDGRPTLVALRALGLGDLLAAVPALRGLARAFPDHHRVLAGPSSLAPLLEGTGVLGPDRVVQEVVDTPPLAPLPPRLHGADVAVNLHGRGPQSTELLAVTGPGRLIAFAVPDGAPGVSWRPGEHEVRRWCRLLTCHGVPCEPTELHLDPPVVELPGGVGTSTVDGATVVHPGAASGSRRWPADRWAEVIRAELDAGQRVVVTGGTDEVDLARRVAALAGLGGDAVLAGRTDVVQLASVVAGAGAVLCGDTGVAHLASAFATPSVVLFGPTPPAEWGPPSGGPHRVLWTGGRGDPHGDDCDAALLELWPDDVLGALASLRSVPADRRRAPAGAGS
jgi:ADP-heptose:LPS heptosyltransferase